MNENDCYEYEKLTSYLMELNSKANQQLLDQYNRIISFQWIHFIPAVRFDSALFLRTLSLIKQPTDILEIGFGSGVSAYFIANPLTTFNRFVTLEKDSARYQRGLNVIKEFNMENISLIHIDAFQYLQENRMEQFDYIFLDATKKEYLSYLPIIKTILKPGGFLICDNTFFNGKVTKPESELSKSYQKNVPLLKEFNMELGRQTDYETSYFFIGDGMSLSIRKQ